MGNESTRLRQRIAAELGELRRQEQFRTLDRPAGINLLSNDYLGLACDPRLARALVEAVRRSGRVGSAGSRLLGGNAEEWEEAESEFAEFAGAEAALYFSSGYAANIGLLSALLRPGDLVFSDALNHASLIDAMRLSGARKVIYPHRDIARLEEELAHYRDDPAAKLIVTESLFSMEGDRAPLRRLFELGRRYGAELVVDEAHAVGVLGPQGRGLAAEAGIEREVLAILHTCGKALGSAGAFVCSSRTLREFLVNRARTFIFSTASPPYLARQISAAVTAARGMDAERLHLQSISQRLCDGLREEGFDISSCDSQIVPLIIGTNQAALAWAESLREEGFAVRAIRPPTVAPGRARLRFSLTAALAESDIERLLRASIRARDCLAATRTTASEGSLRR
ncbi:MAG TPA: 8-amino-7-oxononanoate synthase [Patescibacteria group bacterium]|nr:8-amino-7-oxononanoate synthase [Patescibacteria group bacterium]